jgi:hypothetical protein
MIIVGIMVGKLPIIVVLVAVMIGRAVDISALYIVIVVIASKGR